MARSSSTTSTSPLLSPTVRSPLRPPYGAERAAGRHAAGSARVFEPCTGPVSRRLASDPAATVTTSRPATCGSSPADGSSPSAGRRRAGRGRPRSERAAGGRGRVDRVTARCRQRRPPAGASRRRGGGRPRGRLLVPRPRSSASAGCAAARRARRRRAAGRRARRAAARPATAAAVTAASARHPAGPAGVREQVADLAGAGRGEPGERARSSDGEPGGGEHGAHGEPAPPAGGQQPDDAGQPDQAERGDQRLQLPAGESTGHVRQRGRPRRGHRSHGRLAANRASPPPAAHSSTAASSSRLDPDAPARAGPRPVRPPHPGPRPARPTGRRLPSGSGAVPGVS